jgi:hypothetical protein
MATQYAVRRSGKLHKGGREYVSDGSNKDDRKKHFVDSATGTAPDQAGMSGKGSLSSAYSALREAAAVHDR